MDCVDSMDLEYRGEGNCAIVFANPKTQQVYRLVKKDYTKTSRSKLQVSESGDAYVNVQIIDSDVRSKLEDTVSYVTNIMDPLLSFNYAVIPELILIPEGFGEAAMKQIGESRPVHRRKSCRDQVDPDVYTALVLPDCCFMRNSVKYGQGAVEIPWILTKLCSKSDNSCTLMDVSPSSTHLNTHIYRNHLSLNKSISDFCSRISCSPKVDSDFYLNDKHVLNEADSYPAPNYEASDVILGQRINNRMSLSCAPSSCDFTHVQQLNNGTLDHTVSFNSSFTKTPSNFTISIEIKPKKAFKIVSPKKDIMDQVCRFCMHKYLKTKCGKWPETSSYCPLDLFSGDRQRMKHALISLIKTPQNNLKICKNGCEIYGSDIRQDFGDVLRPWFTDSKEGKRSRVISSFINLVIEILLRVPKTELSPLAKEVSLQGASALNGTVQTCNNSSYVHSSKEPQTGLPAGCVLERIQSIQALDTMDIAGIFPLYSYLKQRMEADPTLRNKWCLDGPYSDVSWLDIGANATNNLDTKSDEWAVSKMKQFLVSKTLQDCSIIAAIQPVSENMDTGEHDSLWFEGKLYQYSINLVDLEPKSFDKVQTYFKQASEIADSFRSSSSMR